MVKKICRKTPFQIFVEGCGTHAVVDFPKTDLGALLFQFTLDLFSRLNYAGIPSSYYGFRKGKSQIILESTLPLEIQGIGRVFAEGKGVKLYRVEATTRFYPIKTELWAKGVDSEADSLLLLDTNSIPIAFLFAGENGVPNHHVPKVLVREIFSEAHLDHGSSYTRLVHSVYALIQSVGCVLSKFFEKKGLTLIDFKIELGVNHHGEIVISAPILLSDVRLVESLNQFRWDIEGRPDLDQKTLYHRIVHS